MKLLQFAAAAIATATLTFAANPKAEATEVYTCRATSDYLNFVYEDGLTGYYIYDDVFRCAISPDGYALVTIVNGYPVQFTSGTVTINGYPYVVEGGYIYPIEDYSYSEDEWYPFNGHR